MQSKKYVDRKKNGSGVMIKDSEYYFMSDLSFYSKEFGGTFHFM